MPSSQASGHCVAPSPQTVAEFERADDGNLGLSFLKGLQIVNGGQTTSSIYFASRDDRTIDLSHVMVPAKIIILKGSQDDARERLISNVSRYANSQNAVKMSDLSANRPFHVQLEKLANETWCPDGATRWFYERAAGAYNVMLLRDGNTPARRRKLQEMIPPKRKLTKNDIAKYHEAWRGKPDVVARGGEKNFVEFMDALDKDPTIVPNPLDARWYRGMIAKVVLFKAIENQLNDKFGKKGKHRIKIIARYQQVDGVNKIVARVVAGQPGIERVSYVPERNSRESSTARCRAWSPAWTWPPWSSERAPAPRVGKARALRGLRAAGGCRLPAKIFAPIKRGAVFKKRTHRQTAT